MSSLPTSRCLIASIAVAMLLAGQTAYGQLADRIIEETANVGIDENLGQAVDLDAKFLDENGNVVALKKFFTAGRPVIMSMNYSTCPQLCDLQLGGLINSLEQTGLKAGDDFAIVSVSFDPKETPEQAKQVLQRYQFKFGKPTGNDGFNFLVGKTPGIKKLAKSLGIRYEYIPHRKEYAHPAAFVICSPEGAIARYVYGVDFPPADMKIWLKMAQQGTVAQASSPESLSKLVWNCFYYDETAGVYTKTAWIVIRVSGALFALSVFGLLFWCHRLVKSKRDQLSPAVASQTSTRPVDSQFGYTQ